MLLLIDFLTLRSREYQSLLQLYQDWEVKCVFMCICLQLHMIFKLKFKVSLSVWFRSVLFLCFRNTEICPSCQTFHSPLRFAIFISVSMKIHIMRNVKSKDSKLIRCYRMPSSCSLEVRQSKRPHHQQIIYLEMIILRYSLNCIWCD